MKRKILIAILSLIAVVVLGLYFIDMGNFICPIKYNGSYIIRADSHGDGSFAANRSGRRIHQGVDFLADLGTPVLAARSGFVIAAKENRGMGKFVIVKHFDGRYTIYGHLSKILVSKGNFVLQGKIIGEVGKTGNANNRNILPHLHFELRKKGVPQDPLQYIH